ncbi:MAG: sigma-70 family RNA polymerase sigma factor [Chloroflexi bacterium]|nr:MAG: sigma-70 family RNA polymerase sigma factor [Chloroflexota bacterium]
METIDLRWERLYAEWRAPLYRAAVVLVGPAEGEEVVQDAFERGMRTEHFFDEVREPFPWLRQVVVRLALSRLRRRALWERARLLLDGHQASAYPDIAWALRRLAPTQRGAVVLRYYFRADYAEIAETLGLSQASVAKTLARAKAALRRDLT